MKFKNKQNRIIKCTQPQTDRAFFAKNTPTSNTPTTVHQSTVSNLCVLTASKFTPSSMKSKKSSPGNTVCKGSDKSWCRLWIRWEKYKMTRRGSCHTSRYNKWLKTTWRSYTWWKTRCTRLSTSSLATINNTSDRWSRKTTVLICPTLPNSVKPFNKWSSWPRN